MKIINYGSKFKIYGDDLQTYDQFPAGTYKVDFHPMEGFSLEKIENFQNKESKIYGNHLEKIDKVMRSYAAFDRSMGVILSGKKGMGKSLFVQLLSERAIAEGMMVVMVTHPFAGIADFLEKIDQDVLFIFDEFEKVFSMDKNDGGTSQDDLLGMFDGTSQKKRMYAITVNKIHRVSEYMLSRTGRFHYHLRFDYPTAQEISVYLTDKLEPQYYDQIPTVITFAARVQLNYDSLRAIAFELNMGNTFASAISDLNILTVESEKYDLTVEFSNGETAELKNYTLNLFGETIRVDGYTNDHDWFNVTFKGDKVRLGNDEMLVNGEDVKLQIDSDNKLHKGGYVKSIVIKQHRDVSINYKMPLPV